MKTFSAIIYAVALILTFSPAYAYVVLTRSLSASPDLSTQLLSFIPMVIGIAMLMVISYKKL